ncbi:hypothetical protein K402DRAFT_425431 [Aulographum hederae CBS 113979]|uniref:Integral membrane protein TmpA n=1 Tax=Aulographum hederae CBS 113979 TaxID=1176131 RepID=A0A6G1GKA6_9PEZI|nr:hypothetical protein K402DRAFT_425431 [Aulographum hederae CBS 113979]
MDAGSGRDARGDATFDLEKGVCEERFSSDDESLRTVVGRLDSRLSSTTTIKSQADSFNALGSNRKSFDTLKLISTDASHAAEKDTVEVVVTRTDDLPPPVGPSLLQTIRWHFFSTYRKIFTFIFAANVSILVAALVTGCVASNWVATCVTVNLFVSIIVRNEHVVNLLFAISTSLPRSSPLWLRRTFAKVYSYGGMHSGCGVGAVAWYIWYTVNTFRNFDSSGYSVASLILTCIILLLLLLIITFAHPTLREKHHNHFEVIHRFAGWTVLLLFWAQTMVVTIQEVHQAGRPMGRMLVVNPSFWLLVGISLCVVYPWSRTRLQSVDAEPLSNHALRLHFAHDTVDACTSLRIGDNPLKETHAFALIPEPDGRKGFSMVVSNAGDWTKRIIKDPPKRIWVKGVPAWGVLCVATMFDPVVIVATGSGIGPCLGLFNGRPSLNCRVIWSVKSPEETYGKEIVETVFRADPKALIIDTNKEGRPDLAPLTYNMWKEAKAEAVIVISNMTLTTNLVFEMESRGIPSFGPIWDS